MTKKKKRTSRFYRYRLLSPRPPPRPGLSLQRQDSLSFSSLPTPTLFLASLQSSHRQLRAKKRTSHLRRQLFVTARPGRVTCDNGEPTCSVSTRQSPPIASPPVKYRFDHHHHYHQLHRPRLKCCFGSSSSSFLQFFDGCLDIACNRTFCAYRSDIPRPTKTTAANLPSSSTFALNPNLVHRPHSSALVSPIVSDILSPRSSPRTEIGTRSTFSFDHLANISPLLAYRSPDSSPDQTTPTGSHRLS